jgi:hypothetical protein
MTEILPIKIPRKKTSSLNHYNNAMTVFCYTKNMKIHNFIIVIFFIIFIKIITAGVLAQTRYAACDLCGYCQGNSPPQSWTSCQKCLYSNITNTDPATNETLIVDPVTNLAPTTIPGKQYTFLGCLGGESGGFTTEGAAGGVVQSLLNIIFSIAGGVAFLYLLYGSFIIATSQANPERLNYGKRVVYGAIAGLIFTLGSVFIVKFIASGILKVPGFGEGES